MVVTRQARALVRLTALALLTAAVSLVWLAGAALTSPAPRARRRWRQLMFRGWARAVASVLGMTIEVKGEIPTPPFFLVSNHLSYVDIVLLAARLDGLFVAKSEVSSWPLIGFLTRVIGTIFVDRRSKRDALRVLALLERRMAEGEGVVIFAEGTSTRGDGVLPLRPALLEWAAQEGFPVCYASLTYRTPPDGPGADLAVCWWGDMTFGAHLIDLLRLPGFQAILTYGRDAIRDRDRKRLAARLHRAVQEQFIPVVTPE